MRMFLKWYNLGKSLRHFIDDNNNRKSQTLTFNLLNTQWLESFTISFFVRQTEN